MYMYEKQNASLTHAYAHIALVTNRSSLQPVASALSFIIYSCRNILLGKMVTPETYGICSCLLLAIGTYIANI